MSAPELVDILIAQIKSLIEKVDKTNSLLAEQNTKIAVMDERKADKSYVDDKISTCSTAHKKTSIAPAALTPKQKQLLVNAVVAIATAVAAFLTAKFGI